MEKLRLIAGAVALAVAGLLAVVVVVRDAVNPATVWTIAGGAIAGVMLLRLRSRASDIAASTLLLLAAAPAMIGGMGWLLVPSMMLAWGVALAPRDPA
ncbi:MAG TPA: hypothetical protein VM841_06195 [Actinomycetota bacterium]|nr:hypothetical protein [Actinomycetota bacterium]